MGFADDVRKFAAETQVKIDARVEQTKMKAESALQELLGENAGKIRKIRFDADVGKFHDVDAPAEILDKLRQAGLLRDSAEQSGGTL